MAQPTSRSLSRSGFAGQAGALRANQISSKGQGGHHRNPQDVFCALCMSRGVAGAPERICLAISLQHLVAGVVIARSTPHLQFGWCLHCVSCVKNVKGGEEKKILAQYLSHLRRRKSNCVVGASKKESLSEACLSDGSRPSAHSSQPSPALIPHQPWA